MKMSRHERIQTNRAKFLATKEAQFETSLDCMVDREPSGPVAMTMS